MTEKERSESIAFLADKLSKALSRITALERDLKRHIDCKCHKKKQSPEAIVNNEPEECEMCSA